MNKNSIIGFALIGAILIGFSWYNAKNFREQQKQKAAIDSIANVEAMKMAEELDVTLLPYELAGGMEVTREVIRQIKSGQSVGIFIGPEGGFEPEEVDAAVSMGAKVITLGRRILRTETAGLATLAVLMFELEQ